MKIPAKLIYREAYLDRVQPFIGNPIIKVLTGHRRVGKSYILYQLMSLIRSKDKSASLIF
jgi:predicted AAA+ superfamily ATPase